MEYQEEKTSPKVMFASLKTMEALLISSIKRELSTIAEVKNGNTFPLLKRLKSEYPGYPYHLHFPKCGIDIHSK